MSNPDRYARVLRYHDRSKHHLQRYARSLGYMDWANQPAPFRFYQDAPKIELPLSDSDSNSSIDYAALFEGSGPEPSPLTLDALGKFLELSLGLSAWKESGSSEWSLRMNPSSGNLHPTECYLLLPALDGHPVCIAHYNPLLHCLEILPQAEQAVPESPPRPPGFGLILSSIYWREAWKYGERAFRYCHHDLGHALAALRFAARIAGWELTLQPQVADHQLDRLLGFDRIDWPEEEAEHTDCLCWVSDATTDGAGLAQWLLTRTATDYPGRPNRLSTDHVSWPVIAEVSEATASPGFAAPAAPAAKAPETQTSALNACRIIRQRRSAQAYDPRVSSISLTDFLRLLQRTLPVAAPPFDGLALEPNVNLVLFVHRVQQLKPGLYLLLRSADHLAELQGHLDQRFVWQSVSDRLPLFLLAAGDYRQQAQTIGCHQEIAGDSAFSLAMLARFQERLQQTPWLYPRLYWECGVIGQVLYLEAEASGLRGTGIGCFFDDVMHDLLGIGDHQWQDLYHFTVGAPLQDSRIQTKPAYHHLAALRSAALTAG